LAIDYERKKKKDFNLLSLKVQVWQAKKKKKGTTSFCFMDSIMEPNKAAHDLAQVRKLIEGMNALVNSQSHLQQQQKSEASSEPSITATSTESTPQSSMNNTSMTDTSNPLYNMSQLSSPINAIIVEVNHLVYNRTLFFSLTRKTFANNGLVFYQLLPLTHIHAI
jgi:hypothetical protein